MPSVSVSGEGRLLHATYIEAFAAAKTRPLSTRPRNRLCIARPCGTGPEHRRRQIGAAVVCGYLRELPSQRNWTGQGPLQTHSFPVPAGSLHGKQEGGLGALVVSGGDGYAPGHPVEKDQADQKQQTPAGAVSSIELRFHG